MKVKPTPVLAAALAMAFVALHPPSGLAQRGQRNSGQTNNQARNNELRNTDQRTNGTFVGTRQPAPPQRQVTPVPSSVILPMGNPVGPMGNPVQPIIPSPFMRYGETGPTVVMPDQSRGNRGNNGRGRDVILVPVAVPTYYYPPYYNNYYPEPEPAPVTIPGQLPGARHDYPRPGTINSPNVVEANPPASTLDYVPQPEVYSEPRMIINEPRPNRVIVPPAIGTSRADVIARFGSPWGTISARGQETLYFDGLVVVFGADGRVVQVR
jgi:hypothetical protein